MFVRKSKHDGSQFEHEFDDVAARLRQERREPTPLELDEIKMRAIRQASHRPAGPATTGASMRRTLVIAICTFSLMASGTGAVLAGGSDDKSKGNDDKAKDNKDKNAGKKQYTKCKTQKSGKSHKNGKGSNKTNKSQQQQCPPKNTHPGNSGKSNNSH